jgi:hypothetical protein
MVDEEDYQPEVSMLFAIGSHWYLPSVAIYRANFCEKDKFMANKLSCYCTSWYMSMLHTSSTKRL